jgi:hypothetical protein
MPSSVHRAEREEPGEVSSRAGSEFGVESNPRAAPRAVMDPVSDRLYDIRATVHAKQPIEEGGVSSCW